MQYIFFFKASLFCIAHFLVILQLTACDDTSSVSAIQDITPTSQLSSDNESVTKLKSSSSQQDSIEIITQESSSSLYNQINSSATIDANSNIEPEIQLSSSSITSSSSIIKENELITEFKPSSSSISEDIAVPISLDNNGFATVADVYKSLRQNEKAIFVIRHSERENSVSIETELTENGIKMAENLGATLKSDEEFSYITSGFVRTNETANHIAIGRGTPNPQIITNYDITGNWFLKISADELSAYATNLQMQGSSIELMSHWAYGKSYPDVLYELDDRANEFVKTVILKNLPKWNRISIMVSHDIFVMPLTVYGSQKKVALKYYDDYHWINYIAGVAIIINDVNEIRYIPIKGADSGIIDYLEIYIKEHHN